jgi:hypothetical protein
MPGAANTKKPPLSRLRWGAIILIIGFLSPLLIPLVLSSNLSQGFKAILSGALAFGIPELFMLIAVAIMGKEGFHYLKRYVRLLFKIYGPPDHVSKIRYRTGLIMFCVPVVFGFVAPYFLINVNFYFDHVFVITLFSDVLLVLSLFVLGGEFWDKLRSLFVHGAIAKFPAKSDS